MQGLYAVAVVAVAVLATCDAQLTNTYFKSTQSWRVWDLVGDPPTGWSGKVFDDRRCAHCLPARTRLSLSYSPPMPSHASQMFPRPSNCVHHCLLGVVGCGGCVRRGRGLQPLLRRGCNHACSPFGTHSAVWLPIAHSTPNCLPGASRRWRLAVMPYGFGTGNERTVIRKGNGVTTYGRTSVYIPSTSGISFSLSGVIGRLG